MAVTRRALFRLGTSVQQSTYWRGSRSAASIPSLAILDEDGNPILDELGQYIEAES